MGADIDLLLVPLFIALLDWTAVARHWQKLGYITKPGVILALLAWLWQATGFQGPLIWFALGLFLSLLGDIFLMLPRQQFIAGLVAFSLALVCYLVGFNLNFPPVDLPAVLVAFVVFLPSVQIFRRIATGLAENNLLTLKPAIAIYSLLLTLFLLSALLTLTRPGWEEEAALACSLGGLLFYCSEILLAWNRFVAPIPHGRLANRISCQLGQILLTLGVVLQFG